jgi:hypothetical protein
VAHPAPRLANPGARLANPGAKRVNPTTNSAEVGATAVAIAATRQSRNRSQAGLKRRDAEGAEDRGGEELLLSPFSAFLSESQHLCVNSSQPARILKYSSTKSPPFPPPRPRPARPKPEPRHRPTRRRPGMGQRPNLATGARLPLSSFGGEGWGEEAVMPESRCPGLPSHWCPSPLPSPRASLAGRGRSPPWHCADAPPGKSLPRSVARAIKLPYGSNSTMVGYCQVDPALLSLETP